LPMARSTIAPAPSPVLPSAGITVASGEFRALLRRTSGVESGRFANHPGGYDAWDAWLASQGVTRVRVCLAAEDPAVGELATYLSETGHEVRLVDEEEIETRPDVRLLLDLAALGEGEPFAPPERFAMPERYARVSWR
jgi:hypothetical protein